MGYEMLWTGFCESEILEAFWCSLFRSVLSHLNLGESSPIQNQLLFEWHTVPKFHIQLGTNQNNRNSQNWQENIGKSSSTPHSFEFHLIFRGCKPLATSHPCWPRRFCTASWLQTTRFTTFRATCWRGPEVVGSFEDGGVWLCIFVICSYFCTFFFLRKVGWSPNVTSIYLHMLSIVGLDGFTEYFWGRPGTLQKTRQGLDSGILFAGLFFFPLRHFYKPLMCCGWPGLCMVGFHGFISSHTWQTWQFETQQRFLRANLADAAWCEECGKPVSTMKSR